jgi:hypothetical protein
VKFSIETLEVMIWKHNARRPVPDSQVELSRGFRSKYLSASLDDDFGYIELLYVIHVHTVMQSG